MYNFTRSTQIKEIVGEIARQLHKAGFDKMDDNDVEELTKGLHQVAHI